MLLLIHKLGLWRSWRDNIGDLERLEILNFIQVFIPPPVILCIYEILAVCSGSFLFA